MPWTSIEARIATNTNPLNVQLAKRSADGTKPCNLHDKDVFILLIYIIFCLV
jgi:hypothetical protein